MAPSYKDVVDRARNAFREGRTLPMEFRRQQLNQFKKMIIEHRETFVQALKSDLGRPNFEAVLEVDGAVKEIDMVLSRMDNWVKPKEVSSDVIEDKSYIYNDPYGVVLNMTAWNYPNLLIIIPTSGAIAAGNAVVIKPSEVAPATAAAFEKLVPKYLDKDCFPVVCGGVTETTALLKERFDYIFYTGSTTVGKIVRDAANKFVTPTTLELGGKSPCYVDDSVDMDIAVRRVLWGKIYNMGQTCIAPDYLICTKEVQDAFVKKAKEVLKEWYGENPVKSPDLCRIVAERHVDRLASYLKDGKIEVGGKFDRSTKFVEPTILTGVSPDSKIMKEEIFGPILPIVNIKNHKEFIEFVNKREKPLSMYLFSTKKSEIDEILLKVSSGGVTINDVIHHAYNNSLPFGGVGMSGMGAYHGDFSFETFTHKKAVLHRGYGKAPENILKARYPPYKN